MDLHRQTVAGYLETCQINLTEDYIQNSLVERNQQDERYIQGTRDSWISS
jgi:hypothetical protein